MALVPEFHHATFKEIKVPLTFGLADKLHLPHVLVEAALLKKRGIDCKLIALPFLGIQKIYRSKN